MIQDNFAKKLLYRSSHRGCKETDLLLGLFAGKYLAEMSGEEMKEYDVILNQTDSDIVSWIMGHSDVPEHLQSPLMNKLLQIKL